MSTPQSYNKVDSAFPLNAKDSAVKANIQALADLFPAAVQEGVVDFDALTRILGGKTEPQPERFGLNWCGKAAAHAGALIDSAGTLRPCREESKDWDTTKNLYIEGDNLEVLKLLRNSYRGKVKMIYIDPPYNTGKDFVYKDNFHDSIKNYQQITNQQNELKENTETSGRYHTDWLNMMYPRLMLARELLCDDGVIFISIDDNEMVNLKEISDEIFGESNFITNLVWKSKSGGANDSKFMAVDHEYILCYAKNSGLITKFLDNNATVTTVYNRSDENGEYSLERLDKQNLGYHESLDFPIIGPDNIEYRVIHRNPEVKVARWRWDRDTVRERFDELVFLNGYVYTKNYKKSCGIARSLLIEDRFGRTRTGKTDFTDLFSAAYFSAPKPVKLLQYLVDIVQDKNAFVLDFFSGSATISQSVMKLNAADGGNRKFIMVQLPEACEENSDAANAGYKNICEIGKERIRRAGEKVKEEAGEKSEGLDIGFRVYKLDSSNVYAWDPDTKDIEKSLEAAANHLKEERSAEDIMTELMLRFGIMLTNNVEKQECGDTGLEVYNIGCGRHFACLDERLAAHAEEVAHFILEWHKEENPGTHEEEAKDCQVFVVDKAFVGNDAAKKNFCAILSDYGIKQVNAF